jgi:hypothetical protein
MSKDLDRSMTAKKVPQGRPKSRWRETAARGCIGVVLASNLSAAVPFVVNPQAYAPAFEVSGEVGAVLVRSIGLLFLMWGVPYVPALLRPLRRRVCLAVILIQQLVGLVGESWMWMALSPEHAALRATGARFILFDGVGFLLLCVAWFLVGRERS